MTLIDIGKELVGQLKTKVSNLQEQNKQLESARRDLVMENSRLSKSEMIATEMCRLQILMKERGTNCYDDKQVVVEQLGAQIIDLKTRLKHIHDYATDLKERLDSAKEANEIMNQKYENTVKILNDKLTKNEKKMNEDKETSWKMTEELSESKAKIKEAEETVQKLKLELSNLTEKALKRPSGTLIDELSQPKLGKWDTANDQRQQILIDQIIAKIVNGNENESISALQNLKPLQLLEKFESKMFAIKAEQLDIKKEHVEGGIEEISFNDSSAHEVNEAESVKIALELTQVERQQRSVEAYETIIGGMNNAVKVLEEATNRHQAPTGMDTSSDGEVHETGNQYPASTVPSNTTNTPGKRKRESHELIELMEAQRKSRKIVLELREADLCNQTESHSEHSQLNTEAESVKVALELTQN